MCALPSALLFDLDGTLVDTDDLHFLACKKLLHRFGRDLNETDYWANVQGKPNDLAMSELFPSAGRAARAKLADEKERNFRSSVGALEARRGLGPLLEWARQKTIPIALVTGAPRPNAELMLDALRLQLIFNVVVLTDELPQAKPHPLPYLTALQKLGVGASDALAFEDSLTGIRSATAAGIETVAIRSRLSEAQQHDAGAAMVISDFSAPELWARLGS
jgi:beta-phosphoglucomutase